MNIALISSKHWQSTRKIRDMLRKIKSSCPDCTIIGAGNQEGGDPIIKKYAISTGLSYSEYNPSFSGKNLYSAMPDYYYGKRYHFSQLVHRMNLIATNCDKMVIFSGQDLDLQLKSAYNKMNKLGKPVVIIQ